MWIRIDQCITKILRFLIVAVLVYLFLISLIRSTVVQVQTDSNGNVEILNSFCRDNALIHLCFLLTLCGILLFFKKIRNRKKGKKHSNGWITVLYVLFFILGLVFIMSIRLEPRSDPEKVLNVARQVLSGDASSFTDQEGYMFRYPFQNGILLLDIALLRIFGRGAYLAFQILNLVAVLVIAEMLGRISEKMFEKSSMGNAIRLFVLLQPMTFLYITYLYGTLLSLALILFAIYHAVLYTENAQWIHFLACSLSSAVAIVLKSNSLIPMIAMLIYLLWTCLGKRRPDWIRNAGLVLGILAALFLLRKGTDLLTEFVSGVATPAGMPKLNWIAMGLSGDGTYNGVSVNIFRESGFDTEASIAGAWANIKGSLKYFLEHKGYFIKWFVQKNELQWNDPSFGCIQINRLRGDAYYGDLLFQNLLYGKTGEYLWECLNVMHSAVLLGALSYWLLYHKQTKTAYILGVASLGGFFFHCFWEAGSQYILPYYLLLLPYAVLGWRETIARLESARRLHT